MDRIEKRINLLHNLKKKRINELLKEFELNYEDYQIILALHYSEGLEITMIKEETKLGGYIIEKVMKHLKEKDYIDVREHKIYLTEKTEKLYPQIKKMIKNDDERIARTIDSEEIYELIGSLDKLIEIYE